MGKGGREGVGEGKWGKMIQVKIVVEIYLNCIV